MKYYIITHIDERIIGEYMNGIVESISEQPLTHEKYIEVEMDETDDMFINQIKYKVLNNEIVRLTDDEFNILYPNFDKISEEKK